MFGLLVVSAVNDSDQPAAFKLFDALSEWIAETLCGLGFVFFEPKAIEQY